MESTFDFLSAALPWIAMGLLLAIFFARAAHRKKKAEKKEDRGPEGMALGMCFGVAISTALHINTGLGLMAGMVLGQSVISLQLIELEEGPEHSLVRCFGFYW